MSKYKCIIFDCDGVLIDSESIAIGVLVDMANDLGADINGINLGEEIRQLDPTGYIIFITTHAELSHLTFKYKVEALDYIIKDDFSEDLYFIYRMLIRFIHM